MGTEVFKFTPRFSVTESLSVRELMKISGLSHGAMTKRFEKNNMKIGHLSDTYSADICNKLLNDATDIENWEIKGYLPLVDSAKQLHCAPSSLKKRIRKYNIPYIHQHIRLKGYIWIKETDINKLDKMWQDANRIGNVDYSGYTSYKQLAEKYHMPIREVQRIGKLYSFPHKINKTGSHLYSPVYCKKLEEKLIEHCDMRAKTDNNIINDMFRKHPLVKDKKCFDLLYFPNPIPRCFEDLGED